MKQIHRRKAADFDVAPTVLLVDNDPDIVEVIGEALRRRGLQVITAADAVAAVVICQMRVGDIDVLVTDVDLPGVSGIALAQDARLLRSRLRVVYMSGIPEHVAHGQRLGPDDAFIAKPCTAEHLAAVIRDTLDDGSPPLMKPAASTWRSTLGYLTSSPTLDDQPSASRRSPATSHEVMPGAG